MDVDLENLALMPMHTTIKLAHWEDKSRFYEMQMDIAIDDNVIFKKELTV